jgi:hypothetical protein
VSLRRTLLLLLLLLLPSPALGEDLSSSMPGALYARPADKYPIFVSTDDLLTATGEIDRSRIPETSAKTIEDYFHLRPEDGCIKLLGVIRDHPVHGPHGDLSSAIQQADLVILGTVTGLRPGFRVDEAGTLVRLTPERFLKGGHTEGEEAYYVFIPIASFSLRGQRFCQVDASYSDLPALGENLLLFIRDRDQATGPYLPLFDATDLVTIHSDSTISLPHYFRSDSRLKTLNKTTLLQMVRSRLKSEN